MAAVRSGAKPLLAALAAALALAAAARVPLAWASGNGLNHVAGAWIALADDAAHGLLYRPLAEPGGASGGTRFFPLWIGLHAALIRLGADPIRGGLLLALVAAVATLLGAFTLLRRLGLDREPAAAFAALVLAGFAVQLGATAVRGDLLPIALGLFGLALVAEDRAPRAVVAAAALFALAFAAKPTALTAAAAAVAWTFLRGERRAALALAGLTAAGAGAAVLATELLSGGRFLEVLRACAAGGMGPSDLARAPLRLADVLLRADRGALATLLAAAVALLAAGRRAGAAVGLAALWLAAAVGAALATFASPGTGVNHLAELQAASAVALGAVSALSAVAGRPGIGARVARAGGIAAAAAGLVIAANLARADLAGSRLADAQVALAAVPRPGPFLSEDPLVPVVAGERPVLLDAFMYRLLAERDPARARPLADAIAAGRFRAVVLLHDPEAADAADWYGRTHLGPAAIAAVRARYRLAARAGPYFVYRPAPAGEGAPAPRAAGAPGPGGERGAARGRQGVADADDARAALARGRAPGP